MVGASKQILTWANTMLIKLTCGFLFTYFKKKLISVFPKNIEAIIKMSHMPLEIKWTMKLQEQRNPDLKLILHFKSKDLLPTLC